MILNLQPYKNRSGDGSPKWKLLVFLKAKNILHTIAGLKKSENRLYPKKTW